MALASGTRVGPYEIVSALGAGGMGEVYRATDTKLKRQVAIKILPPSLAADPDRLARFQREAEVLASLNHPHIAAIYGLEDAPGVKALVMELVEGEDLSQRIARGPIPIDEALPIAKQIAEALEAAHEQGIIHRDLKPANIKVRSDGTVKVLDFGLAKLAHPEATASHADLTASPTITSPAMMTGVGMILGTAAYMSPEQARGGSVDKRADIWAFGSVLYEMLAGHKTFDDGESVSDALAAILKNEPDWSVLPASTPANIRTLLRRCLEKDRRRRLADIGDARLEIDDAINNPAANAESPAATTHARRATSMRMAVFALVIAIVSAIVAGLTVRRLSPPSLLPITRFALALPAGQQLRGVGRSVAIAPDGSHVAYALGNALYLRSMSSFDVRQIQGAEGFQGSLSPVFSPDGRSIAFWSVRDQMIKSVPLEGGAPVTMGTLPREDSADFSAMTWDRDGILLARQTKGIVRLAAGAEPQTLIRLGKDESAWGPQMLLDREHVLFTLTRPQGRASGGELVVQSVKSGARKKLTAGSDGRYLQSGHLVYAVEGVLFAVGFDPRSLELHGRPVPVVQGVRRAALEMAISQFSVSENGTLVYIPGPASGSSAQFDLAFIDDNGTHPLKLPAAAYQAPRVSPDGTRVAFSSDDGKEAVVWMYNLAGASSVRRLTLGGRNRFPVWSADGARVAFQSDREHDLGIFVQHADGSGTAERLTTPEPGTSHVPEAWSPKDDALLYTVTKGTTVSLWALSLRDKKATHFGGVDSFTPTSATFSPDSRWVAYATTEASRPLSAVFVQPFPATGAIYQISRDDDGHHPLWSRDGRELSYVPGPGQMSLVSVTTQPTFAFTNPRSLPPAGIQGPPSLMRNHDALADGRRFIGVVAAGEGQSGSGAAQINVVLNWTEELKRLVPTK